MTFVTGHNVESIDWGKVGERYAAARGSGATWNGEPIHVSDVDELSEAFVLFGTLTWDDAGNVASFRRLVGSAKRTRAFGDFWGHMLVARGAAEVMIEEALRTWDTAAVRAIVEEAGGRMSTLDGGALEDHGSVLTTNGALHDAVVDTLR